MKQKLWFGLLLGFLVAFGVASTTAAPAAEAASGRTYNVLVGWENAKAGFDVEAFFPETVTVHVGDRVHWIQNTHEIHTVSFLAGGATPDLILPSPDGSASPIMLNPAVAFPAVPNGGQYDGSTFASSGIMGVDPGQQRAFTLTFTKEGTYPYICIVHGQMMKGTVVVVGANERVSLPSSVSAEARREIRQKLTPVSSVWHAALKTEKPAVKNPDGTTTHYVMMGYGNEQVDVMNFFPKRLVVHPGDTVVWEFPEGEMAPHTVTFLNGGPDIELFMPVPQASGPPLLLANPALVFPHNADHPLTRAGLFSSGLLDPTMPGPHSFSLKIGNITGVIPYECLIHDASGMKGELVVVR